MILLLPKTPDVSISLNPVLLIRSEASWMQSAYYEGGNEKSHIYRRTSFIESCKNKTNLLHRRGHQSGYFFADRKSAILDSIRIDAVWCYSDWLRAGLCLRQTASLSRTALSCAVLHKHILCVTSIRKRPWRSYSCCAMP